MNRRGFITQTLAVGMIASTSLPAASKTSIARSRPRVIVPVWHYGVPFAMKLGLEDHKEYYDFV